MIKNNHKYIFAGGGTGGHLYPAIAVADAIKEINPNADILFVGTKHKIESKVVPSLGYKFKTIIISGFSRKLTLKNILFPFKLIAGLLQSFVINSTFKPVVVIGTGAYVSGPVLFTAYLLGSKIVLLEQNSYPGITNRMLEKKADQIHISFPESEKYFSNKSKIIVSGNPIRIDLKLADRKNSLEQMGLNPAKKTILILGGSLGADSINNAVKNNLDHLMKMDLQIIWQTGQRYYEKYQKLNSPDVKVMSYVENMSRVYSAADLIVARAGATTIAELACLGLPAILVPSTNVAANHQYKNAQALETAAAAYLLSDDKVVEKLGVKIEEIITDETLIETYKKNIKNFSSSDSAKNIAEKIISLSEN